MTGRNKDRAKDQIPPAPYSQVAERNLGGTGLDAATLKRGLHMINGKIAGLAIGVLAGLTAASCPAGATEISTFSFVDDNDSGSWSFQLPTNLDPTHRDSPR